MRLWCCGGTQAEGEGLALGAAGALGALGAIGPPGPPGH